MVSILYVNNLFFLLDVSELYVMIFIEFFTFCVYIYWENLFINLNYNKIWRTKGRHFQMI